MDVPTRTHLTMLRDLLSYRLQVLRSEVDEVEERHDLDEMVQIEAALYRLDAGIYGECVDCGDAIDLRRLMVQPAVLRCAACQSALDHRRLH